MEFSITKFQEEKNICIKHLQSNTIERCNYIVEVGAYTVSTDKYGKTKLCNVSEPTQFSKDVVDHILDLKFVNQNGKKINPKVFTSSKWYQEKLSALEQVIAYLKNPF
jgi:hypothetical protein